MVWFTKEPDTIEIDLQKARNMYAALHTAVKRRLQYLQEQAANDKLSGSQVMQLNQDINNFEALNFEVSKKLDHPKAELDVDKIIKILEIVGRIAGAIL